MREVTLFGKYTFPAWNAETNGAELARLSSALYLFDRVWVVDQASVPGLDTDLRRRMELLKRTKEFDEIVDSGLIPPSTDNSTEELMRAGVGISELQRHASRKLYAPLIKPGVVRVLRKDRVLEFDTACVGHTATIPHWRDAAYDILWRHGIECFVPPVGSGAMYSAYYALLKYAHDLGVLGSDAAKTMFALGSRDVQQQMRAYHEAMLFEFFHSSFAVPTARAPIVFQHAPHAEMYEAVLRGISAWSMKEYGEPLRRDELQDNAALSARLLGQTLVELPMLVPRAPEAILEIREIFDEERRAFIEHVDRLSEDLSAAGGTGDEEIVSAARRHLVRPFRDLERKLKNPGRRLAKNLLSSPGLVGASIAFAAGVASGGRYGALLAALGSILSSAVSTRLQEEDTVEASNVSFLLRVQRHESRRRSG